MEQKRIKVIAILLRYAAGIIFAGMVLVALDISASLSGMQDSGYSLYHDTVDVNVFWFESKACLVLPPDNYLADCTQLPSIGVMVILTMLLIAVLLGYLITRRKLNRNHPPRT